MAESHLAAAVSNAGGLGIHWSSQCTCGVGANADPRSEKKENRKAIRSQYYADESLCR